MSAIGNNIINGKTKLYLYIIVLTRAEVLWNEILGKRAIFSNIHLHFET